jgi:hypothetical protein
MAANAGDGETGYREVRIAGKAAPPLGGSPMRRFLIPLAGVPVGYLIFAFAGYWAIEFFSANMFDRDLEAAMTSMFAIGPVGAIIGFIVGLVLGGARRSTRT